MPSALDQPDPTECPLTIAVALRSRRTGLMEVGRVPLPADYARHWFSTPQELARAWLSADVADGYELGRNVPVRALAPRAVLFPADKRTPVAARQRRGQMADGGVPALRAAVPEARHVPQASFQRRPRRPTTRPASSAVQAAVNW